VRLDLKGFSPDLDPATPGILTDCDGIVPTTQGLSAANSPVLTKCGLCRRTAGRQQAQFR